MTTGYLSAIEADIMQILVFFAGVYLVKRRIINNENFETLYALIEFLFYPCFIITLLIKKEDFFGFNNWQIILLKLLNAVGVNFLNYLISYFTFQKIIMSPEDQKYSSIFIFTTAGADCGGILYLLVWNLTDFYQEIELDFDPLNPKPKTFPTEGLFDLLLLVIANRCTRWGLLKKFSYRNEDGIPYLKPPGGQDTVLVEKSCDEYDLDNNYKIIDLLKRCPFLISVCVGIVLCLSISIKHAFVEEHSFLYDGILSSCYLIGKMAPLLFVISLGASFFLSDLNKNLVPDRTFVALIFIRFAVCLTVGYIYTLVFFLSKHYKYIILLAFIAPAGIWSNKEILRNDEDVEKILLPQYVLFFLIGIPLYAFILTQGI